MLNKLQVANNPQAWKINAKCANNNKISKVDTLHENAAPHDKKPWWQGMGGLHFEFPFTNDS
jgi:hypothetical protein